MDYGTQEEKKEHKDTYDKDVQKDVTLDEFATDIAKDQLKLDKNFYNKEQEMEKQSAMGEFNSDIDIGDYVETSDGNGTVIDLFEKDVFNNNWRKNGLEVELFKVKLDNGIEEDYPREQLVKLNIKNILNRLNILNNLE